MSVDRLPARSSLLEKPQQGSALFPKQEIFGQEYKIGSLKSAELKQFQSVKIIDILSALNHLKPRNSLKEAVKAQKQSKSRKNQIKDYAGKEQVQQKRSGCKCTNSQKENPGASPCKSRYCEKKKNAGQMGNNAELSRALNTYTRRERGSNRVRGLSRVAATETTQSSRKK